MLYTFCFNGPRVTRSSPSFLGGNGRWVKETVPVERVITGEATLARINADQVLQVTPTIGADGQTIDLNLHLLKQDEKPGMTTTVTVWPGQTVFLSGVIAVDESGKPTHSRAIPITPEIE